MQISVLKVNVNEVFPDQDDVKVQYKSNNEINKMKCDMIFGCVCIDKLLKSSSKTN